MLSNYKVITVTHHSLNLRDIGAFYLHPGENETTNDAIRLLKTEFNIEECIYLETCNRVCFILYTTETITDNFLKAFFQKVNPALSSEIINAIQKFVTSYEGDMAIRHVFEMASSMDSLIVGEREIFRQFRKAYNQALENGICGDRLRILEKATVKNAKEIYHNTKIGEKALSVVSLAMQSLMSRNLSTDKKILLVGSGETNTLVGKFLLKYGFENVSIYNRSIDNAKALSTMMQAPSFHLRELSQVGGDFDVMFVCTSANQVIIDVPLYKDMLSGSQGEKIIIDLAVPRNVSEDVVRLFNVDYIDIEALRQESEKNLAFRKKEMEKAKPIIQKNVSSFNTIFQQRQIEKALSKVPAEIKAIKKKAINSVYRKRIESLDLESQALLHEMMDYMEKKCVSIPMKMTREEILSSNDQHI